MSPSTCVFSLGLTFLIVVRGNEASKDDCLVYQPDVIGLGSSEVKGSVRCSESGTPGVSGSKGTQCMKRKISWGSHHQIIQGCDFDAQHNKNLCKMYGNPTKCCTVKNFCEGLGCSNSHQSYQIQCAGVGSAFTKIPDGSDFEDCSAICGEVTISNTCFPWCAKNTHSWLTKCQWKSCKACVQCDTLNCKPWCAANPTDLDKKCKWKNCKGCDECTNVEVLETTCEPWCAENTDPKKCNWKRCRGCDDCSRRLQNDEVSTNTTILV